MTPTNKNIMKAVLAITGGFLVHLTLGTVYTYGNMTPYITSYIRKYSSPSNLSYSQSLWVYALEVSGQGLAMFVGGIVETKIGSRWAALLGGWFMSAGVLLSYFTVKSSFGVFLTTYGIMFGIGVGLAYAPPLNCAMKWMPGRKGLANGIVVAGFGGGAFIFDQIQTEFLNPGNLPANTTFHEHPKEKYFDQEEVLSNLPDCFLLLGLLYAFMQLVGSLLLYTTPDSRDGEYIPFLPNNDPAAETCSDSEDNHISKDLLERNEESQSYTPKEMLLSTKFYFLWFTFFFNGVVVMYISTLYKAYGETFITSDKFLATVGALAAICNAGGRIIWGMFMDRFSYRMAMLVISISTAVLQLTYILTPEGGETMYLIWVCLMFLMFSGNYALFPTAIAKAYGPKYVSINYGLVFTSQVAATPIGAFLATQIKDSLGWFGFFGVTGAISVLSAVLASFTKI